MDDMDRDFLIDLFAEFGPVTIRRMFSGFGISADGVNFALALRGGLYLRADETNIPRFEAEGTRPFQYQTRTKSVTVNSYWQLPERLYDDPQELADWARVALAAAQRAALGKRLRSPRRKAGKGAPAAAKKASRKMPVAKKKSAKKKIRRSRDDAARLASKIVLEAGEDWLRQPRSGLARHIRDLPRRPRGCGRHAWPHKGTHPPARSGNRCRRPA